VSTTLCKKVDISKKLTISWRRDPPIHDQEDYVNRADVGMCDEEKGNTNDHGNDNLGL
jgi:hypothetical protein